MSSLVSSLPVADQSTLNLGHIDSRTKNIVYGYIGRIQSLLLLDDYEEDEINRHIPRSVYLFCVELVDDHFMIQQTTKQWTFRGPLLHRMLNAVNGQLIETEQFEACKMQWKVQIYPNGDSNNGGKFHVNLVNMDMPSGWKTVTICFTIHIQQLSFTSTTIRPFDKQSECDWGEDRLSFQELTNLHPDRLTMALTLRVLQIKICVCSDCKKKLQKEDEDDSEIDDILYHYEPPMAMGLCLDDAAGHYSFEWKIDDELAQTIRNNLNNLPRRYESATFHNLWKIVIWPNDSNNRCTLGLMMLGLPKQCQKRKDDTANVRWSLGIKEGAVFQQKVTKFSYCRWTNETRMVALWNADTLTSTEFQTYTTVTICAEIQILDLLEDKEDKDDQLKKAAMHINDEWKQYMAQNGNMEAFIQPTSESVDDEKQETKELEEAKEEDATEKDAKKQEVRKWLSEDVKLPQYCKLFIENGFDDLECFDGLTYAILDNSYSLCDIKKGHRLKILRYVKKLQQTLL
mmetsp:Transcript_982/g.1457  ORF Transcript_982/g.1457 Transcript_982/m.1457 type:complete len:514 (-) Transcript_982:170-1711(-)